MNLSGLRILSRDTEVIHKDTNELLKPANATLAHVLKILGDPQEHKTLSSFSLPSSLHFASLSHSHIEQTNVFLLTHIPILALPIKAFPRVF
jgi:hypothetical protein